MNAARRKFLTVSLASRLDEAVPDGQSLSTMRALWLIDQLENYVERWWAFNSIGASSGSSFESDDLFGMIEIAAGLLNRELEVFQETAAVATYSNRLPRNV